MDGSAGLSSSSNDAVWSASITMLATPADASHRPSFHALLMTSGGAANGNAAQALLTHYLSRAGEQPHTSHAKPEPVAQSLPESAHAEAPVTRKTRFV